MSGLRVGQTFPIEIKKKQVKYWEILELNAEQKKLATNRMNAKRRALAQRADDEVSEKRQDGRVEDNAANSDIYNGANDKDTVKQLNRLKRENADLRSRLLKLERVSIEKYDRVAHTEILAKEIWHEISSQETKLINIYWVE